MTDTATNLEHEIESAMNAAWPDMDQHDRGVVQEDIAALCRVHARTSARVVNAEVADWYVEDRGREVNGISLPRWQVAVLVRVPKQTMEAERQRQAEETREAAKTQ